MDTNRHEYMQSMGRVFPFRVFRVFRGSSLFSSFGSIRVHSWLLLLCVCVCLCTACKSPRAAAGHATYTQTTYSETGSVASRTALTVHQNEDPAGPTKIIFTPSNLEVSFSDSFIRRLPKSFAHMETILLLSGILCLLAAAALGGIGQHWRLMTIAIVLGGAFIAIAVTIEAYAWAYALGLLAAAIALSWYLWRRYKAHLL